jgi:hypothetical protein
VSKWNGRPIVIPLLGLSITLAVWFLELRTAALLANVVQRGAELESAMGIGAENGFFKLMTSPQPLGVQIPFLRTRVRNSSRGLRYVTSHRLWFEAIYVSFIAFWINALWVAR